MIIEVTDGYELRCIDGMNWQVFHLKSVEKKDESRKKTGVFEEQWVGLPSYHGSISAGIDWIINHMPKNAKNREERKNLQQFLADLKKITGKLERLAKKMEGAANGSA